MSVIAKLWFVCSILCHLAMLYSFSGNASDSGFVRPVWEARRPYRPSVGSCATATCCATCRRRRRRAASRVRPLRRRRSCGSSRRWRRSWTRRRCASRRSSPAARWSPLWTTRASTRALWRARRWRLYQSTCSRRSPIGTRSSCATCPLPGPSSSQAVRPHLSYPPPSPATSPSTSPAIPTGRLSRSSSVSSGRVCLAYSSNHRGLHNFITVCWLDSDAFAFLDLRTRTRICTVFRSGLRSHVSELSWFAFNPTGAAASLLTVPARSNWATEDQSSRWINRIFLLIFIHAQSLSDFEVSSRQDSGEKTVEKTEIWDKGKTI